MYIYNIFRFTTSEIYNIDYAELDREIIEPYRSDPGIVILYWLNEKLDESFRPLALDVVDYVISAGVRRSHIKVLINNTQAPDADLTIQGVQLQSYDFFADTVVWQHSHNQYQHNHKWNKTADKILFKIGKPQKPQRIVTFYYLTQSPIFDKLLYSFAPCDKVSRVAKEIRSHIETYELEIDYAKFARQYERQLDDVTVLNPSDGSYHYTGFPYDHTHYADTKLSIISETEHGLEEPWVTEKTWTAIYNNHPFVLIADNTVYQYLEQQGFQTFGSRPEQFIDVPDAVALLYNDENLDVIRRKTNINRRRLLQYSEQVVQRIFDNNLELRTQFYNEAHYQNY